MRLRCERSALQPWLSTSNPPATRPRAPEEPPAGLREQVGRLVREGQAYLCYCTPTELAALRAHQEAHGQAVRYGQRCLSLYAEHRADYEAAGRKPCVRFRLPEGPSPVLDDLLRGRMALPLEELEDFVLLTADGRPGEVLETVLERTRAGVSHVVRTEARRMATARELLLYDALGLKPPRYAHTRPEPTPGTSA